ncbi:ankyrin [Clathrospora elynae]|uniref:Ankyrin n=1 Tax=Clathrospora elynae TaxID=706981 RepID=A0A6A5SPT0_9PLEO|nr:ankyrin [Clathrospora elynae]
MTTSELYGTSKKARLQNNTITGAEAASSEGHEQMVKLLLEKNSDVNAQGGRYGNALQATSYRGHEQVVKLLLEKNAEVNAQGGHYGNEIQVASGRGHEQVVQLLLDAGA